MIKKILLTLWIVSFSLVWFTHWVSQQWLSNWLYNTTYSNLRDNTLNLFVPTDYSFYTIVWDTQYNSVYAIYDKLFFFWDIEWVLSIYNWVVEWNNATKWGLSLNKFYICDYISWDFNSFTNCSQYFYDIDLVNTYLNSTVSTDRIIYWDWKVSNYEVNLVNNSIPFLAFSIEWVQKTILFYSPIWYIYDSPTSFDYWLPNVDWQVNYNVSFTWTYDLTTFPDYYIWNSPIIPSNQIVPWYSSPISWDYVYNNCTNWHAINNYSDTYWYSFDMCNSDWSVASWYYQYNTLKEYCQMYKKELDYIEWFEPIYTWRNYKVACRPYSEQQSNSTTWNISSIDLSLWTWNFNGSWEYIEQSPTSFLVNLTNILKGKFYVPWDQWFWFLPWYIVWWLLFVILFRFLSH